MLNIRRAKPDDADFIAETYRPFVEDHYASFELKAPDAAEIARRMTVADRNYVASIDVKF